MYFTSDTTRLLPQAETLILGLPATFNGSALGGGIVPAYTVLNLRMEWNHILGSQVSGAVNVMNATDRTYKTSGTGLIAFGLEAYSYGPPRMVTVELSTKF
jgi:outer membrane receptor protein involved in Fe transport